MERPRLPVGKTLLLGSVVVLIAAAWATTTVAAPLGASLVPPSMEAPIKPVWLRLLQLITFFLHLVLVNIVIGSVLMTLFDRDATDREQPQHVPFIPSTLALAVNFGVAPYLFLQVTSGSFLYPTLVLMAVWWISVVFAIMLAYYGLYVSKDGSLFPRHKPVLTLTALMLLLTALTLSSMSSLMIRPDRWTLWFASPLGTILNFGDPSFLPRYLHVVIASFAVGGLTLAWRGHLRLRQPHPDRAAAEGRIRRGLGWFYRATLLQAAAGPLFLLTLPPPVRDLFLGGSALHTVALGLGLTGLVVVLSLARRQALYATTLAAGCQIFLMVCIRSLVRDASLLPYQDSAAIGIIPLGMPDGQTAALWLFLACAGLAIIATAWMIRLLVRIYCRAAIEDGEA